MGAAHIRPPTTLLIRRAAELRAVHRLHEKQSGWLMASMMVE